ncbi:hypothetical protein GCM10009823_25040 [Brevibacterium salitolerans]|uniref:Uncharacterized protein n=1 Tax=Brevibacterium salitolerans TaxID=1403566 RepID=A0ABN2WZ65_9MICO
MRPARFHGELRGAHFCALRGAGEWGRELAGTPAGEERDSREPCPRTAPRSRVMHADEYDDPHADRGFPSRCA